MAKDNTNKPSDADVLSKTRKVKSPFWRKILHFLMVVGPGIIVMEADNDAGAVSTYTEAGAHYGTRLFWVLLLLLPFTYFAQEMVVRLGIATGRGYCDMIYQRFGKWWGRFSLFDLLFLNFLTLITEFAAISLALSMLGISPWISVPVSACGLIALVLTGGYLRWQRITIILCLLDIVWFVFAYHVGFNFGEALEIHSYIRSHNTTWRNHFGSCIHRDRISGHNRSALATFFSAKRHRRQKVTL